MKLLVTAAVALSTLTAASVTAETAPTTKVRYGDLDVHTPAGLAALTNRVKAAARNLCRNVEVGDLATHAASIACFRAAWTGAMAQVPTPEQQIASR